MANKQTSSTDREFTTDNPSIDPQTGAVNPSSPTVGTEGWGNTADERKTLSANPPSMSRQGQTADDPGTDRAEPSRTHGATAGSMDVTHGGTDRTYRCADAGNADCRWETSGSTEDEIMEKAREHAQTEHGWNDWTEVMRKRVRDAIRERRAA